MPGRRVGLSDPGHAAIGQELKAHTLVWGAGLQGNGLSQSLGIELERGNRIGVGPDLTLPDHPEVYVVGDIAAITDTKTEQVLPQLGSVALQSGEHAGESIAPRIAGKDPKPFEYRDKGTMAAIGRKAAVVQMLGGRTMTGVKAQLAWGTVHLALLPTNEDRAKAIVDWAGAAHDPSTRRPDNREQPTTRSEEMTDATTEFFDELAAGPRAAAREGDRDGALRPRSTADRPQHWLVSIVEGRHRGVAEERARRLRRADATRRSFDGIASGRENAIAAVLRGAVGIEGDLELLMLFERLFPGPARSASARRLHAGCAREAAMSDDLGQDPRRQHVRRQRRARRHRGVAHRPDRPVLVRHPVPVDSGC